MSKELERIKKAIKQKDIYEQVGLDEDIEELEKKEKALEIIKRENIDLDWLKDCIKRHNDVWFYNDGALFGKLTQEEYDLLKEVLL